MYSDLFVLHDTKYYQIINKETRQALSVNEKSKNYEKQPLKLQKPNDNDLSQFWMFSEVSPDKYPGKYEFVHVLSSLVLQCDGNSMSIKPGKWKSNQLHFLQRPNQKINQYWIKPEKDSSKYFTVENGIACFQDMMMPSVSCYWQFDPIEQNPIINASCYIESVKSNMVLDVPQASQKAGISMCQYPFHNKFNQKWNLIKQGEYYKIQSLQSKLFLDIKGESKKPGTPIIQWQATKGPNQLWKLQLRDSNLYVIRSVLDQKLLLSVKDGSIKQCADIVTSHDENQSLWRIVGFIPF